MKISTTLQRVLALSLFASAVSYGADILDVTSAVLATDPTQKGRLSRNGIISDWSSPEPFPGVLNPGTTYHYREFDIQTSYLPYLEITVDDIGGLGDTFVSAYQTSYDPKHLAKHYLGDEGASGNFFGTDPTSFQVVAARNSTVAIIVNTTAPAGLGEQFELIVQGYVDTNFNDTPEPAGVGLTLSGLAACGAMIWRKRKRLALAKTQGTN